MMIDNDILELQVARPRGSELASIFVGQSVQEDGILHMASRVDPLFLLLPILGKHPARWCPLDQMLAEAGCGDLLGLQHLDARKICDTNGKLSVVLCTCVQSSESFTFSPVYYRVGYIIYTAPVQIYACLNTSTVHGR